MRGERFKWGCLNGISNASTDARIRALSSEFSTEFAESKNSTGDFINSELEP
jgi:hypothetical protein